MMEPQAKTMIVSKDTLVRIAAEMHDLQGHLLDQTPADGIWYLHGRGDVFPAFEAKLEGLSCGKSVSFTLEPEEAFGEFDEELVTLVPVSELGDPADIRVGLQFEAVPGAKTSEHPYRITDIAEGVAVLDANHPLTGWTLRFDVKILEIAEANSEGSLSDVLVPDFLSVK